MREFISGSTAIVRGALDAGCTFFAGYPITPASSILSEMMHELPRVAGVAVMGEDEIAAIGMCIGATMAGARSMTATSGPGLSLFSENIGLAIMGEVPLVIVDVQRMGPATGGATTVGQGDVQFVRWGTSGGYPIIALSPSSTVECYTLTLRAFDLAERFRCPVFVVTDAELSMTMNTIDVASFTYPKPRARSVLGPDEAPYKFTPADSVGPLGQFGRGDTVRFTGSTHDEEARITKSPATVARLNEHLFRKVYDHVDEIELCVHDKQAEATTLLISYGVTAGAMREAVSRMREEELPVSALTIQSLWPVPERALCDALTGAKRVVVAELNHGQYRREIERLAKHCDVIGLHAVDGDLISPESFVEAAR